MKCYKCRKEMGREDGNLTIKGIAVDVTIEGIAVDVTIEEPNRTPETIAYNNIQLGKYSNGKGECHVAICYECYIDGLFSIEESNA